MEFGSESSVLQARREGKISVDAAFEQLYSLYAPTVRGWAKLNQPGAIDDLSQDVWFVFYQHWRSWSSTVEGESQGGRPVLSFLYRTLQFTLKGYRRRLSLIHQSINDVEISNGHASANKVQDLAEAGRLLALANRICPDTELQILQGKLAGLQASEIAAALDVTPSVVDHAFRNALSRIRNELTGVQEKEGR